MTKFRNIVNGIKRNWNRRQFWRLITHERLIGPVQQRVQGNAGVSIMDRDWDNLLILDGCRYDIFETVSKELDLNGNLNSVTSRGSGSVEFLRKNFKDKIHHDTIYVTGNPFANEILEDDCFFNVDHVWLNGWNEKKDTVMAETILERAIEEHDRFPDKRLIAHFMQPHVPFVASEEMNYDGFGLIKSKAADENEGSAVHDAWEAFASGNVTKEEMWQAYRENLEYVLPIALDLAAELDGKTVITSDHGNSFGEYTKYIPVPVYGHPNNLRMKSLTEVPWLELEFDTRRSITNEPPEEGQTKSGVEDEVNDRLESLGYMS